MMKRYRNELSVVFGAVALGVWLSGCAVAGAPDKQADGGAAATASAAVRTAAPADVAVQTAQNGAPSATPEPAGAQTAGQTQAPAGSQVPENSGGAAASLAQANDKTPLSADEFVFEVSGKKLIAGLTRGELDALLGAPARENSVTTETGFRYDVLEYDSGVTAQLRSGNVEKVPHLISVIATAPEVTGPRGLRVGISPSEVAQAFSVAPPETDKALAVWRKPLYAAAVVDSGRKLDNGDVEYTLLPPCGYYWVPEGQPLPHLIEYIAPLEAGAFPPETTGGEFETMGFHRLSLEIDEKGKVCQISWWMEAPASAYAK